MARKVLVTGASGYIAKHIIRQLLDAGFEVRGSVRSLTRGDEVRKAVAPHLADASNIDERLTFVVLNLAADGGWTEAMNGIDVLMHTASPFPLAQPEDEDEVIRPAVDGALRALRAAKGADVRRVVMTSSTAAIMSGALPTGKTTYDEECWSDVNSQVMSPYAKSKTLAEQAAWQFQKSEYPEMELTVINPSFVIGMPMDENFGTSIQVVERMLRAKDPMLPRLGFQCVDVADVATMHVKAIDIAATHGERIMGVDRFMWFSDMAQELKVELPDRRIITREAPNFIVRLFAIFDKSIRGIIPDLGKQRSATNRKAVELLGMRFRDTRKSFRETGRFLVERNLV